MLWETFSINTHCIFHLVRYKQKWSVFFSKEPLYTHRLMIIGYTDLENWMQDKWIVLINYCSFNFFFFWLFHICFMKIIKIFMIITIFSYFYCLFYGEKKIENGEFGTIIFSLKYYLENQTYFFFLSYKSIKNHIHAHIKSFLVICGVSSISANLYSKPLN